MADSIGILRFFLSLAVGAIMIFIAGRVTEPLFATASEYTSDNSAAMGTEWLQFMVDYSPWIVLGIAFFGFVAYSVFVRRGVLDR